MTAFNMYLDRMQEIVSRLRVVEEILYGRTDIVYLPATVESVYLQFRHVLELIATASLSVNPTANDELRKEGRRMWHAGDILKAVETVNKNYYYPQPVRLVERDSKGRKIGGENSIGEFKDFEGDYLDREKFNTLYSTCSRILHTPNPFYKKALIRDAKIDRNQLKQAAHWYGLIIALLTHHKFRPLGEPETKFFICYTTGPNAHFMITPFVRKDSLPNLE